MVLLCRSMTQATESPVIRLTLADAIRAAVESNLEVRAERYTPAQQEAEYQKSRGIYDPILQLLASHADSTNISSFYLSPPDRRADRSTQLNAGLSQQFFTGGTATLGFNNSNNRTDAVIAGGLDSYWHSSLGVTVSQPLLKNFGREATELAIDTARLGKYSSIEQFNTKLSATVAQVRNEYYNLYSLREELEVKKVSLELARKILVETQARVKAGVMPAMEILNAEFGVASRERELIDAERAVSDQSDLLRQLLQLDRTGELVIAETPSKAHYEVSEQDQIRLALELRPEIRELKRNLELLELQARVSHNRTLPDVTLSASAAAIGLAGTYSKDMDRLASGEYPNWSVGLALAFPLGNRAAENEYRKNRLKAEQASLRLRNQQELVSNEVRAAVRAVAANYKQLEVAERGRAFAEERFKAFVRKAEVGLATNKDVLDVEHDLATARNNQIKAQTAYANAITQLWRVTGELLDRQQIRMVERDADQLYRQLN
jgi:outer membrane protein TolC